MRLYISDLDGTLLNADAQLDNETVDIINRCIDNGMCFTFATARTVESAVPITKNIKINCPCILMNGVSIYDIPQKKYIKNEHIPFDSAVTVTKILEDFGQYGFMYKIQNDVLYSEYIELDSPALQEFYDVRRKRYNKPFYKVDSFSKSCNENVIYFALLDGYERLYPIKEQLDGVSGIKYEFYRDIYSANLWYLEIFSEKASKYNGVKFLRENYGFDFVTGFGDNFNDIPLFNACDIKVAVENAKPELKKIADYIAPANIEKGIAKWLDENMGK